MIMQKEAHIETAIIILNVYNRLTGGAESSIECATAYCERQLLTTDIMGADSMRELLTSYAPLGELLTSVTYPMYNQEFWVKVMDMVGGGRDAAASDSS